MDDDPVVSRTEVRFNSVYVIESLPEGELKTGRDLYDSVVFPGSKTLDGLHTEFMTARNRMEFAQRMAVIARGAKLGNHHPMIHIEAHGSDDGIMMADGSEMKWKHLLPLLGDINQSCRFNLIVVAVSCMGWNLTAALMPSDRAPVNMVIGPIGIMRAGDLLDASRWFYRSLFEHLDLNRAIEAMNGGKPYDSWRIKPGLAEILYCRVFRDYVAELTTPAILRRREDEIIAQVPAAKQLTPDQTNELRAAVRHDLRDHRSLYERFKRTYLMVDLFPENEGRFGLTYDRCFAGKPVKALEAEV